MGQRHGKSSFRNTDTRPVLEKAGLAEDFLTGQYERVEQAIQCIRELKVSRLRTTIAWSTLSSTDHAEWLTWLMPRLAAEIDVLPCLSCSQRDMSPQRVEAFATAVRNFLTRWGRYVRWIELRCGTYGCPGILPIMQEIQSAGKQVVLSGIHANDTGWLESLADEGVIQRADAIGLHGLAGRYGPIRRGWNSVIAHSAFLLKNIKASVPFWITETGFSTWHHQYRLQIQEFVRAMSVPVDRVYWRGVQDTSALPGTVVDRRHIRRNMGLRTADGRPKLLYRLWQGTVQPNGSRSGNARTHSNGSSLNHPTSVIQWPYPQLTRRTRADRQPMKLITGGAGFIGRHLAQRLAETGHNVLVFDNLSRPNAEQNLEFLLKRHGDRIRFELGDMRDMRALRRCVRLADQVFHLATQVSKTASIDHPREDFEINATGTLNLLEAIRVCPSPPSLLYASTSQVYGPIESVDVVEHLARYEPTDSQILASGLSEQTPLDFRGPQGCSQGVADQYVLDYSRTFNLRAVVLRISCVYGPHQNADEEQGWVVHFLRQAINHQPLSIPGDGKQVRDILPVDELVDAMLLAQKHMETLRGQAFNIGGGPANTLSPIQLLGLIEELNGSCPPVRYEEWRPGDPRYYVSDTSRFQQATRWRPHRPAFAGIQDVFFRLLREPPVPRGRNENATLDPTVRVESPR